MLRRMGRSRPALWLVALLVAGCSTTAPYTGQGPHPQITRGHPNALVDSLGNVFALPIKLILFTWRVDDHEVPAETEAYLVRYVDLPQSETDGTHFSLNEYAPGRALKRLTSNKKVAWPYRLLLGLPITLVVDVLLPGRIFAGLLGGDLYNPYTDTVSIYSSHPAISLHEAGHVHDFNSRTHKGTYALIRLVPFVDLYQEFLATDEAVTHLIDTKDQQQELNAYKVLYPAYGTYVGGYVPFPGVAIIGALVGHFVGRAKARERAGYYAAQDQPAPLPATP